MTDTIILNAISSDSSESADKVIAQYQTARIRTLWKSYKRIFQLTEKGVVTLDPNNFTTTNKFSYEDIVQIVTDEKVADQFTMVVDKQGSFMYKTSHRSQLLCQLFECCTKATSKFRSYGPFRVIRLRKSGIQADAMLTAAPYAIVELDLSCRILQEYRYVNITKVGIDSQNKSLFFESSGRIKIFSVEYLDQFITGLKQQLLQLGLTWIPFLNGQKVTEVIEKRFQMYASVGSSVACFDVYKPSRRYNRQFPRQLHITEEFIIEKDPSGAQNIAFFRLDRIYAIVRSWDSQKQFTIEFDDGSSRIYFSSMRDTVLAILLDVSHAIGNIRMIVTGEVSDSLRLMPRFAEEQYVSSIADAFFGTGSIESWFVNHLSKVSRKAILDIPDLVQSCRELNANVPCPGISSSTDTVQVKAALSGVCRSLQYYIYQYLEVERSGGTGNPRAIATLLQTLYRLLASAPGFKYFVDVREVDPRLMLVQLLHVSCDFVNYWTLQVLMCLCRCQQQVRNIQQEFVNKHTLLTDPMLSSLVALMSSRVDGETLDIPELAQDQSNDSQENGEPSDDTQIGDDQSNAFDTTAAASTVPNVSNASTQDIISQSNTTTTPVAVSVAEVLPNSLVIVGAAALLESILSSNRDTSSPELMNKVLDLLCGRCEVLVHMLRSTSFLIMENASILMHVLLKNRPAVSSSLQEAALSECLVLKHFYCAMFSPSGNQRFISRFLVSNWMSGSEDGEGKRLLRRMIPSGLVEYLKYNPISDAQKEILDTIEEEYYARNAGNRQKASLALGRLHGRMRRRIDVAQGGKNVDKNKVNGNYNGTIDGSSESKSLAVSIPNRSNGDLPNTVTDITSATMPMLSPRKESTENFRIMFHVMTQDHQLPDLIWNEQTRLELRTALEAELSSFEREQRLRGLHKVAWNYQHFSVRYDSLKDELRVGSIYIRYYLEAGDSFLRTLHNPPHSVLFEKLMRRVLVNVERNSRLAILCTRCLNRLCGICADLIGPFDDMMLMVRLLEQADNMELQHYLIDLLEQLCATESNLSQLLETDFVSFMMKFCSLAHLNPDQIGNVLARATSKVLMLTQSSEESFPTDYSQRDSNADQQRRSLWVPEDAACPRMWFVAPPGPLPPPLTQQRGPFRVTELLAMIDKGTMSGAYLVAPASVEDYDSERYEATVDTGRWKSVCDNFQLRLQLLSPGHPIYSPANIACKCLNTLHRLANVHKPTNTKGIIFHPTPTSKRLMSDQDYLSILAQLLICNSPKVVETAADILRSLVEYNITACSKLYLTGTFFFVCSYTGNNFLPLARLLHVTHLRQSFHDSVASVARELPIGERSVLGRILPPAVINILEKYGPEKFTNIFTGEADTPEVIWNAVLRKHMVEMVTQHLGDFGARLRQHNLERYEYCPIPKVHYMTLEKELYCQDFYLRNLCDELKFPNWPISKPLLLLRETIERWRTEMSKSVEDQEVVEARQILDLSDGFDNGDLRRAYKAMARRFHPDRNPNGRDMFEKIHKSYELLSSVQLDNNATDMNNVVIILKTQLIIYQRNGLAIARQKYPVYGMIVQVLSVPSEIHNDDNGGGDSGGGNDGNHHKPADEITLSLLDIGTKLIYYSLSISPHNSEEFVRVGALPKLFEIFVYALTKVESEPSPSQYYKDLLSFASKGLFAVTKTEIAMDAIISLCPEFAVVMYRVLAVNVKVPIAVENCIDVISNCAGNETLQRMLVGGGVVWRLVPLLLVYDNTLSETNREEEEDNEGQRVQHNQRSSNAHAERSARALGRLAGVMFDDLRSPVNPPLIAALGKLLTVPLAKLLRNRRPEELLNALNENVEKPTKIWNVSMRSEIMSFVLHIDKERDPAVGVRDMDEEMSPCKTFEFTSLKNELCVDGVYLRIFNKSGDVSDIGNPSLFCEAVLHFIRVALPEYNTSNPLLTSTSTVVSTSTSNDSSVVYLELAVETLRLLIDRLHYIPEDIAKSTESTSMIYTLLNVSPSTSVFNSTIQMLPLLTSCPAFVQRSAVTEYCVQSLLKCACAASGTAPISLNVLWSAIEGFAAIPEGLSSLLSASAVPLLLGIVFNVQGFNSSFQNRLAATTLLSKFLWHPYKGPETLGALRRFLPDPVVSLIRSKGGTVVSSVLDCPAETPELIWTTEMQTELREALVALLRNRRGSQTTVDNDHSSGQGDGIDWSPKIARDFFVNYRQLAAELYIGGVYVRLYLRQPTFHLSNPVAFLEGLVSRWEESIETQIPDVLPDIRTYRPGGEAADAYALVLGKEDFLSLLTSCVVCLVKAEGTLVDHLVSWGFVDKAVELLKRALDGNRRGVPVTSVSRLLHQITDRVGVADALAAAPCNTVQQLTRVLDEAEVISGLKSFMDVELPKEASLTAELLKKIFTTASPHCQSSLCAQAVACKLPFFIADFIVAKAATDPVFQTVRNPSALRVYCVDLLKIIAGCEPTVQTFLDKNASWKEYSEQGHDLFITNQERTDPFLIEDSSEKRFIGLLTDGDQSASYQVSSYLTSTGRVPSPNTVIEPSFGTTLTSTAFGRFPSRSQEHSVLVSMVNNDDENEEETNDDENDTTFMLSSSSSAFMTPVEDKTIENPLSWPQHQHQHQHELVNGKTTGEVTVKVVKGKHGVGLDLSKGPGGMTIVQRLKTMPPGVPNPSVSCEPCVLAGDIVVSVNGEKCISFVDTVKKIRSSEGLIVFVMRRTF